ncbi:MAG: Nif3-like dinuclear metal center hexameric protein [Ignavibacteriaceae bacterium]
MKCSEIIKNLEEWAPKEIAWQKDNVGLQIGSADRNINNILLCLELTSNVIDEAEEKNCNLIISHHPLLFHPLKKVDLQKDKNSRLIEKLIKKEINLYSEHTNLDYTKNGVSFELAKVLGLKNIDFLIKSDSNQYKLVVFVPQSHIDQVADALFNAGCGLIGEYANCSFRTRGEGSGYSNPSIGKSDTFEKVEEFRLEVVLDSWKLNSVIKILKEVHPYDEPAFDVYSLKNQNSNYGAGAIGEYDDYLSVHEFLSLISKNLNAKGFRYAKGRSDKIKRVAVCGGSGGEYIRDAIKSGAEAYVTADIKYHDFHDAEGEILLIDAGHYETENPSLNEVERRLTIFLNNKDNIKIFRYSKSTNPIIFFNN